MGWFSIPVGGQVLFWLMVKWMYFNTLAPWGLWLRRKYFWASGCNKFQSHVVIISIAMLILCRQQPGSFMELCSKLLPVPVNTGMWTVSWMFKVFVAGSGFYWAPPSWEQKTQAAVREHIDQEMMFLSLWDFLVVLQFYSWPSLWEGELYLNIYSMCGMQVLLLLWFF